MRKAVNGSVKAIFTGELVPKCCYRTPDGLMCAIGCHIADEHYSPNLETMSANSVVVRKALEKSGVPEFDGIFLGSLQNIHDNYEPHEWKEKLEKFAADFGLTFEI
jgi:hypothetical protein